MAVRIRLQRYGKKGKPFFHIVIADGRAPRDGRFIERIGSYNPVTQPATIDLDLDLACKWLKNGAQPSDTVRSILSYKGAMLKRHLQIGVEKGAITQETADAKFNAWAIEKENKASQVKENKRNTSKEEAKKALAVEIEVNAKRAEAIAKKRADEAAALRKSEEVVVEQELVETSNEEVAAEPTEASE